ncbi:MAG: ABC transporter ATP-binding protein [Lacunisphaera sp.]|jgi:ABC-2 type transport system ATP-binding protein|nr:ABC transporter ATP-binding protein [Lacunisphaera sp.]
MNIIETTSLSRRYWRTEALRDLTLAVPAGSIFALLGSNGAGKTTAIKVLMNLLPPTSGSATVLGVDSRRLRERERAQIGYVSENQKLPLWMSVRQLLDYCRPFYPTWDAALETKLLAQFDLPPERKLKHLSRGMLMKAALLSTLCYRPKLLVLDEPFSGLDPLARDDFVRGLLEASGLGDWTVLVSSHDIEEVERLADNIALLEGGRLRFSETTESLLGRFRRMEVTVPGPVSIGAPPAGWLELEQKGGLVKFIVTNFARETTEKTCREYFPEGAVAAHPMTLREIFVTLARETRTQPKGAAA